MPMPLPNAIGGPVPTRTADLKLAAAPVPQPDSRPSPVRILREGTGSGRQDGPWSVADLPDGIARRIVVHPYSGCWVWTGRTDRDGYGRYGSEGIHRVVWRLLVAGIPADRPILDHQAALGCIFRCCCYPAHLLPSTVRENTLRGRSFAAINAAKTRCDRGHPYTPTNTYRRPNGHRDCRACIRRRAAEYARRQRAFARAA